MDIKKENSPFVIDFKSNYGTTSSNDLSRTPSTIYCLHSKLSSEKIRGHCHKPRLEGVDVKARKKLIIASILCVLFMIAEAVGGILSNSLAIATDAAHLLTDFASFMISLFAIWIAGRPSTQRMSFGWYRAEVIGALASVIMIWVITGILVYLAIERVIVGQYEVDAKIMLITSALAILVNLIIGIQLGIGGHGHSHGGGLGHSHGVSGHGHSHNGPAKTKEEKKQLTFSVTEKVSDDLRDSNEESTQTTDTPPIPTNSHLTTQETDNKCDLTITELHDDVNIDDGRNINVRAAFIHVVGDVVQSIGVFVAALLIYFKPEWSIADPICTFVFSIIVLCTTFAIMKDALLVLMEGTPSSFPYAEVVQFFQQIEGVERVHNLRIWALSVNKNALSVHLVIRPGANPKHILQKANTAVHRKYNFFETTIQIEDLTPDMDDCQQCIVPEN